MYQYKYSQYQLCVKMCHICSSRPGLSARCTDYALRTGLSGLSLVSACCQSESSRLGRPGSIARGIGSRAAQSRGRCNLESSNGTLGIPPLFTHSWSNWSAGSSSAESQTGVSPSWLCSGYIRTTPYNQIVCGVLYPQPMQRPCQSGQ